MTLGLRVVLMLGLSLGLGSRFGSWGRCLSLNNSLPLPCAASFYQLSLPRLPPPPVRVQEVGKPLEALVPSFPFPATSLPPIVL